MEKGDIRKQGKEKMKFGFQEGDSRSNGEEKKGKKGELGCSKRGLEGETRNERRTVKKNGMKRTMSKREKRECDDGERRGEWMK